MVLLAAFGIVPTGYAIYFAVTNAGGYFAGLSNFTTAAAISVELLVICVVVAAVFVTRSRFFDATETTAPGPRRQRRAAGLLLAFGVFFVLPVIWLLLAATKTDPQLVRGNPLSFGSWHALRQNWDALTGFQGDVILLWLRNSALHAALTVVITLAVAMPAGYALAMTEFCGTHGKQQAADRLNAGALWQDHDLVFASAIGAPLDRHNVLREFRKSLRLRAWGPTGCRGRCATPSSPCSAPTGCRSRT
jgi:ABC-type Fe3+ transport system permease subunit